MKLRSGSMIDATAKAAHERLRDAGWTVELRTDKSSRNDFTRKQCFAYTSSNGDVMYDLEQALERLDRGRVDGKLRRRRRECQDSVQ